MNPSAGSDNEKLFVIVLEAYLSAIYKNNQIVEIFLDSRRSRNGKITPQSSYELVDVILKNYLRESGKKLDVAFVPVTINYDRVIDGEVFPQDLLGEKPFNEGLGAIIKQLNNTKRKLGKVVVRYGEPLSLENMLATYQKESMIVADSIGQDQASLSKLSHNIGQQLVYHQQ